MSEEQIEELKKNPYYAKYADKIAKLQTTSPEEFLSRLAATAPAAAATKSPSSQEPVQEKEFSLPGRPTAGGSVPYQTKSLDKILKLDLMRDKSKEEIAKIWTEHYAGKKDSLCAVIPVDTYKIMQERFKEFSTFLFPLPRKGGYEFVLVQFQNNEAHFTTLINFQAHKENAPECLNLVHYTELMDSKGIVLMVGEFDKEVLGEGEARLLAVQTLQYYGAPIDNHGENKKLNHLYRFKYDTEEFHHLDLIAELDSDFPPAPA